MIFVAPQNKIKAVKATLSGLVKTTVKIDQNGTQCYRSNSGELI